MPHPLPFACRRRLPSPFTKYSCALRDTKTFDRAPAPAGKLGWMNANLTPGYACLTLRRAAHPLGLAQTLVGPSMDCL